MTIQTLKLSDALTLLPTHEDRLACAERIKDTTGSYPWGVAGPEDPPDISAAILTASWEQVQRGVPPIQDAMAPWDRSIAGITAQRDSIGPTICLAMIFAPREGQKLGWMVARFPGPPNEGSEVGEAAFEPAEHALMVQHHMLLLEGDEVRFALP